MQHSTVEPDTRQGGEGGGASIQMGETTTANDVVCTAAKKNCHAKCVRCLHM